MQDLKNTQYFKVEKEPQMKVSDVIDVVYHPTYITSHRNARSLIMKVERDELVEEILRAYIKNNSWK